MRLLSVVRARLGHRHEPRPFQDEVAGRTDRVVFVNAGCGSGKTLAAYLWAARVAQRTGRNRRLFFCYPTTGTATEGYRDYMKDPSLDAELVHGRAAVDRAILTELSRSSVDGEITLTGELGDDESDHPENRANPASGSASQDSADALEQWSTPIVSCTVDTVLGLVQNNRRGIYAWPSIAKSAFVFDEIHSYDSKLFQALLRFLTDVPGVPCLLMTATLDPRRLEELASCSQAAQVQPPSTPCLGLMPWSRCLVTTEFNVRARTTHGPMQNGPSLEEPKSSGLSTQSTRHKLWPNIRGHLLFGHSSITADSVTAIESAATLKLSPHSTKKQARQPSRSRPKWPRCHWICARIFL